MRLILTMVVRDEDDIIEENLAYHLNAGVDFVIVTDNGSHDRTREIVQMYVDAGYAHVIDEPAGTFRQGEWATRMARLAAIEFGADWVIHTDADQFWWPEQWTLKEVFAAIPPEYGVLRAPKLNFLPRPETDQPWPERLTLRHRVPPREPGARFPLKTSYAIAHRAAPDVTVGNGNHRLLDSTLRVTPTWYPILLLHFPERSWEQFERKAVQGGMAVEQTLGLPPRTCHHWRTWLGAWREEALESVWQERVVTDAEAEAGLAAGVFVHDRRLAERLAELHHPAPEGFRYRIEPDPLPTPGAIPTDLVFSLMREEAYLEVRAELKLLRREIKSLKRNGVASEKT